MAEVKGKLCSCDLCGRQIFLKCTGEGETDGGFTRWNKFEPYPEEWGHDYSMGRMCPSCNAEYKKIQEKFQKEKEALKRTRAVEVQEWPREKD